MGITGEQLKLDCTDDCTSCPCPVCDQARLDHWADQQFDDAREARIEWDKEA